MKIAILTQDAPMYLTDFMRDFLGHLQETEHEVVFVVLYSALSRQGVIATLRERYQYYGLVSFVHMLVHIVWHKLLDILSRLMPMNTTYSMKQTFTRFRVPIAEAISPNGEAFRERLKTEGVELLVSVACPRILKDPVLNTPPKGAINYHTALLPKYRGRQPLFWAMLHDEDEVGVTVHEMDSDIDNGPIVKQLRVPIDKEDSLHSLYLKTIKQGAPLLLEAIEHIASNSPERIDNDSSQATYFGFPTAEDAANFRQKGKRFF